MLQKSVIYITGLLLAISMTSFAEEPPPTSIRVMPQPPPPNYHGQMYYGPDYTTGYHYTTVLGGWGRNDPYPGSPYGWGDERVWVPGHTVAHGTHNVIIPGHWEYR